MLNFSLCGFVFAPKVPSVGSLGREPEVEVRPTVFSLWRRLFGSAAKRGLVALLRGLYCWGIWRRRRVVDSPVPISGRARDGLGDSDYANYCLYGS